MLCDTSNWSDDNYTLSGIAILDTTAIPEMRSAISMSMFVSVVSSAALMQKIYEIGLYLLTAARALIVVL